MGAMGSAAHLFSEKDVEAMPLARPRWRPRQRTTGTIFGTEVVATGRPQLTMVTVLSWMVHGRSGHLKSNIIWMRGE